jgi:hypothetical protein
VSEDFDIEGAAKQLDRILGFFPRVESKASFLFALNSALLPIFGSEAEGQPKIGSRRILRSAVRECLVQQHQAVRQQPGKKHGIAYCPTEYAE